MSDPILRGSGPDPDPLAEVARLRRLADDLEAIHRGGRAPKGVLGDAPILMDWEIASRPSPCLAGTVTGHPGIDDGRPAITSDLWVLDPVRGYARTLSRWYRLGRRRGD